jgi:hypothetical protein
VLRTLEERLDGIDLSIDGQVFEGLRVASVDLHIDEVRFKRSELLRGTGTVVISGGDGRAGVADVDLSAYLASVGLPIEVRFDQGAVRVSGSVKVAGITAAASVTGDLVLADQLLRFTPTAVDVASLPPSVDAAAAEAAVRQQFAFTAPVPKLQGVRLTAVGVGDGEAFIGAVFDSLVVSY